MRNPNCATALQAATISFKYTLFVNRTTSNFKTLMDVNTQLLVTVVGLWAKVVFVFFVGGGGDPGHVLNPKP